MGSIPTRGKQRSNNQSRFNNVNNIYDSPKNSNQKSNYPKLVSASSDIGYRVVAPKSLWNENTEQNIRAMLNRRANKRMQEIAEDFDIAMYPHS